MIYLDESDFDMRMNKEYGYSLKGKRLYGEVSGNRFNKRITVISALKSSFKLLAPIYFTGNTDTEAFNYWIKEHLLPELKKENISKTIVMNNAAFHKSQKTRELIEKAGHKLLYLPPYSPDFNLIEHKWGHVKTKVKNIRDKFNTFEECLDFVLCYQ